MPNAEPSAHADPRNRASADPANTTGRSFFGQPYGLATLFFTEMWERFSYYGLRPLLVLFMSAAIMDGGFGFDRKTASAIVGIYAASVYLASLPGGWIADRFLGLRRSIEYGAILITLGHLSIGLSAALAKPAFFVGLVLIVLGTGLLKPNISAIVGDLYPEGGSRRDAGFSIFYMGINVGAFFGQIVTGILGEKIGWHWGFGAAGVGMAFGFVTFKLTAWRTLGEIGGAPASHSDPAVAARQQRGAQLGLGVFLSALVLVIALASAEVIQLNAVAIAESMRNVMLAIAVIYFGYLFFLAGLTLDEKVRVGVILVLFVFAMIFWAAFEQAPTSLNLFAADFTDRKVLGWEVPALWFQSINSFFIFVFAPLFAALWVTLGKRNRDLSSPDKFALGLFLAAIGFVVMYFAAGHVVAGKGKILVSAWWLTASYFFQTLGELCLSPVGLSSMTKLAPRRFTGQMMGVWFLASALGNLIAGLVGGHVDPEQLEAMPELFGRTAISLVIAAAVLVLLAIPIRRMMADRPTR